MARLIRFEDAYGMADLICLAHGLNLINLDSNSTENSLSGINDINYCEEQDTYYECGVSFPALLLPSNELIANIKKYNIQELILVYDMDSPKAGEAILSEVTLKKYLMDLCKKLKEQGLEAVSIKLVPVVWSAETFALYVLACDYENKEEDNLIEPTKLIHSKNTAKFQGKIIEQFLKGYGINGKAKHLREYIGNKEKIIVNLEKAKNRFKCSINEKTLSWIVKDSENFLLDIDNAIQHQIEVNNYYKDNLPKPGEVYEVLGSELDMNRKCW